MSLRDALGGVSRGRRRARRCACRPWVELLEARTLLAASIAGTVWNGTPGGDGLAGIPVYLDLNQDGKQDGTDFSFAASAPASQSLPLEPDPDGFGVSASGPLTVNLPANEPDQIAHVRVSLNVDNATPDTVAVLLFSPQSVAQGEANSPYLLFLAPGEQFNGSFDDQAAERVPEPGYNLPANTTLLTGTYQPDQLTTDQPYASLIYQGSPDGDWYLFFLDETNATVVPGFSLNSWSVTMNVPEPSTVTDANGAYEFTGLAAGTYDVGVTLPSGDVQTAPAANALQQVTLADGQAATGINFAAQAAADLAGVSFQVVTPPSDWGQPVTVQYTLVNQGQGAAGAFDVDLCLSATGTIDTTSLLLDTFTVDGLAAGATATGTLTVTLPGAPGSPPAGFTDLSGSFIGVRLDPNDAVVETNKANNANQGPGIDEAPLVAPQAQQLTTDPGVQQQPSVAVNPNNPNEVAIAYMDYSLLTTGYAGIAVASSSDGGSTWQVTSVPLPAGFNQAAGYPTVEFNNQGQLFISFMAVTFLGNLPPLIYPRGTDPNNNNAEFTSYTFTANNGIFIDESNDGGLSWGDPVAVVSHLYTGTPVFAENIPDLAIDTFATLPDGTANPNYGNVYVTWTRAYPPGQFPGDPTATGGSDIMLAVSADDGQTWTTRTQNGITVLDDPNNSGAVASGNGYIDFSHVTVGPQGDVYVSAVDGGDFWVFHSFDAGQTFTIPDNTFGEAHGIPFPGGYPTPTLNGDQFRTLPVRQIAADPTRPGVVYAVEAIQENGVDTVAFAVSDNYGQNWEQVPSLSGNPSVLNATPQPSTGQALPHLAVDKNGDISIIWYDTERDPNGDDLDVFGTISTDGGQTFSAPFRLTSASFDPNAGVFTDASGQPDYFLGDATGLAMADGTAYAAWTDTSAGNQDIDFERFQVPPGLAPLGDRFEPNNTPASATPLGTITAPVTISALTVTPGDVDWYQVTPSSGILSVALAQPAGPELSLQLYDATGTQLLATGSAVNDGAQLLEPVESGQTYLIEVTGVPFSAAESAVYALTLESLTADLGTAANVDEAGSLTAGGQDTYLLTVPVTGSLSVTATAGADFGGTIGLTILATDGQTVLATGQTTNTTASATLAVSAGESVLLQVTGGANADNSYTLEATNFDAFETSGATNLFFPTQATPTALAAVDLNGDGILDLVAANANTSDAVDVLLGNADGTFQASRGYDAGPGGANRGLVVAPLTNSSVPAVAVTDFNGDSVSVLLGNGDGTLQPARPSDATLLPGPLALGDFNGDGIPDLAVLQLTNVTGGPEQVAVLLGRGDGTYLPPTYLTTTFTGGGGTILVGDFTGDGKDDIVAFSYNSAVGDLFVGNGNGTFQPVRTFDAGENVAAAQAVDLGNGALDLVTTGTVDAVANVLMNDGRGNFSPPDTILVNPDQHGVAQAITGLAIADVTGPSGTPDGIPDLIAVVAQRNGSGSPQIILLQGQDDAQGNFAGFVDPQQLAVGPFTGPLAVGAFGNAGVPDIAAAVTGGIEVFYGMPLNLTPNTTQATARDLGPVFHYVSPTEAIVPGFEDSWFQLTVPAQPGPGGTAQVVDCSAQFAALGGPGLDMAVVDANGAVLGSGPRFRVVANQGQTLYLHVFGVAGSGTGTFTLDVDVLPQVVSVQPESLLPGGPTTSLVLSLQGDQLDPTTATNPANYTVTWLGPNGAEVIPLTTGSAGSAPVLYDGDANVAISTGVINATASRHTLTLQFASPLPDGLFEITLSDAIQTAPFTADETDLLAGDNSLTDAGAFAGHPLVAVVQGQVSNGSTVTASNTVASPVNLGDLSVYPNGTPFLGQLHDDTGAVLVNTLTTAGDAANTADVTQEIIDRVGPGLGAPGQLLTSMVVIWLDPISFSVTDPAGNRVRYDLPQDSLFSSIRDAFVSVAGNIELLVLPTNGGTYNLNVFDVTPQSRGGVVVFSNTGDETLPLTEALRSAVTDFAITVGLAPTNVNGSSGSTPTVTTVGAGGLGIVISGVGLNPALGLAPTVLVPTTLLQVGPATTTPASAAAATGASEIAAAAVVNGANEIAALAEAVRPAAGGDDARTIVLPTLGRLLRDGISVLGGGVGRAVQQLNRAVQRVFSALQGMLLQLGRSSTPAPGAGAAKPASELPVPSAEIEVPADAEPCPRSVGKTTLTAAVFLAGFARPWLGPVRLDRRSRRGPSPLQE